MKCCINDVNFIRLLLLCLELFKFEIQKYGQILCVHKPYFLMPGHIYYSLKIHSPPLHIPLAKRSLVVHQLYVGRQTVCMCVY